ncbi:MAG: hypothetical protein IJW86_04710 [Clostridia bacterium]|nr:hypothetical protein [Clostridia bacterium]
MKKAFSVILAILIAFSCTLPSYAVLPGADSVDVRGKVPVILIAGDGDALYSGDGEKIFHFSGMADSLGEGGIELENVAESVANVMLPFVIDGLVKDEWDAFYENLEKEIGDIFEESRLDNNANPKGGSGISDARKAEMAENIATDKKADDGTYSLFDYRFWYDWRLDPLTVADDFNDYVKAVKKVTGAPKVAVVARCLGSSVVTAYIAKYGTKDITGVSFNGSVVGGAEILSEVISGKFRIEGDALSRVLADTSATGMIDIDSFVVATVDLVIKSGVVDMAITAVEEALYDKLIRGMTSALALSTFFTWPGYWAAVKAEDYDTAIEYVFGPEGSEKRIQYKGLIEKIENYDKVVRQNFEKIMKGIPESGANICVISKYGFQIIPICVSANIVADQFATVACSSFGATTSTIYDTLSDEYIAEKTAEGLGRYISPDKKVDASTCLFPDYTWFVKGSSHSLWTEAENIICYAAAAAEKQMTPSDFPYTQFMVFDDETDTMSPMTTENCNTELWEAEKADTPFEKLTVFIKSFVLWIKEALNKIFG